MNSHFRGALVFTALTALSAPARSSKTRQDAPPRSQTLANDRGIVQYASPPRSDKAPVKQDAASRARLIAKVLKESGYGNLNASFDKLDATEPGRKDDPQARSRTAPEPPTYKAEIVEVAAYVEYPSLLRHQLETQVEQKLPEFAACFTAAMQRGELTMDYGWTAWYLTLRRDGTLQPSGTHSLAGDRSPAMLKCFRAVLPRLMSKAEVEQHLVSPDEPFPEISMSVKLRFRLTS